MIKHVEGPIAFTALEPGCDLERGGEVAGHENAIRLTNGTELVAPPAELAEFGKQLVEIFGFNPAPCTDPQVLLVGRLSSGFSAYGFAPTHDAEGEVYDRMRFVEEEGSEEYVLLDVKPLTELNTLHGNDPIEPVKLGQPGAAATAAPVVRIGKGWPEKGAAVLGVSSYGSGGRPSYFAIVDGELIEAVDVLDDGTPDWANGGIVDIGGGAEEGFFFPAWSLLRFMNTEQRGDTSWTKRDHDDLTQALRDCKVESWTYDSAQDCYRVSVGVDDAFDIRTPAEARAYVAGLRAVR